MDCARPELVKLPYQHLLRHVHLEFYKLSLLTMWSLTSTITKKL